jgi:DNA-binding NarL/FixJ family response regulator
MEKDTDSTEIIIADTQYLIVEALKTILADKYEIKEIVSSKYELLKALQTYNPKLLILDFSLIDFDGFDDLKELRKKFTQLNILILTNNISRNELVEFNNIGIMNILHKNTDAAELLSCLDATLRGKKFYSDVFLDLMLDLNEKKGTVEEIIQLTSSEIDIVRLIAEGLTTKEIACKKFISFHTVMTHRKNILRKLGVSNASELIMYAIKTGIIDTIEYHI